MHLLVFQLDDQRFGLPVSYVREVVAAVSVTALPAAPAVVDGVIDVRGEVVPVYDLRVRFGRERQRVRASEHFILADEGSRMVALRADRVLELVELDEADISAASTDDLLMARLAGVARLPDGLVFVQDLASFLDEAEAATLDHALHEHVSQKGMFATSPAPSTDPA